VVPLPRIFSSSESIKVLCPSERQSTGVGYGSSHVDPKGEGGEGMQARDEKVHGGMANEQEAHEKGNAGENSLILMMDLD
jgi:hypothetical protein